MTSTITHQAVADRTGITIPPHLEAQADVPVVASGWRQGDVYAARTDATGPDIPAVPIAGKGVKVVAGEADRNSHVLNGDGTWQPGTVTDRLTDFGLLTVPDGGLAVLTHTGEHGSVAFGPGRWRLWGQRSFEAELRRAQD